MNLGEKIRQLRLERNLALRELARRAKTTAPHLSDIEWGRRFPSEQLLVVLAAVLGVSAYELSKFDTRAPIEELRKKGSEDPQFAVALRRVIDSKLSGEELLRLIRRHGPKK